MKKKEITAKDYFEENSEVRLLVDLKDNKLSVLNLNLAGEQNKESGYSFELHIKEEIPVDHCLLVT